MKARTHAAKLKAKRGRPRNLDAPRTPSGQISRAKESNILEMATWKRRQIFPHLSIEAARMQEYGSVISMWKLQRDISEIQYTAADRFHKLHAAYLAVIRARSPRSSSDFGGAGGFDGSDPMLSVDRDKHIEQGYKEARRAILESGPLGMMAIEAIVLENRAVDNLLPDLRLALNSLSRRMKMEEAA